MYWGQGYFRTLITLIHDFPLAYPDTSLGPDY